MLWTVDNPFPTSPLSPLEASQQGFSTRNWNSMDKSQFSMGLSMETGLIMEKPLFLKRLSIK